MSVRIRATFTRLQRRLRKPPVLDGGDASGLTQVSVRKAEQRGPANGRPVNQEASDGNEHDNPDRQPHP